MLMLDQQEISGRQSAVSPSLNQAVMRIADDQTRSVSLSECVCVKYYVYSVTKRHAGPHFHPHLRACLHETVSMGTCPETIWPFSYWSIYPAAGWGTPMSAICWSGLMSWMPCTSDAFLQPSNCSLNHVRVMCPRSTVRTLAWSRIQWLPCT